MFLLTFILQLVYFVSMPAQASTQKPIVNILTWWGYLDDPSLITHTELVCNVKISHDVYYSNDEFLRRWSQSSDNYDIIIFSNTIYKMIDQKLNKIQASQLSALSNGYNPTIKKHYLNSHYPHNVAYFAHALTGIIYNPKNILIPPDGSYRTLFDKSTGKIVVLLDDAAEINNFFNLMNTNTSDNALKFDEDGFKKMCRKSDIYVGNDLTTIFNDKRFGFSFFWSGDAITTITKHPGFKFVVLPKISYISTDLIAQTSDNPSSQCVALELSKKDTLNNINKKNNYFSPYANESIGKESGYWDMYHSFLQSLNVVNWITPLNTKQFNIINEQWEKIKLSLLNKNQQNWSSQ